MSKLAGPRSASTNTKTNAQIRKDAPSRSQYIKVRDKRTGNLITKLKSGGGSKGGAE